MGVVFLDEADLSSPQPSLQGESNIDISMQHNMEHRLFICTCHDLNTSHGAIVF